MKVPELRTVVFVVPGRFVKNADERLVVLNDIARSVVEARRGKHTDARVFASWQAAVSDAEQRLA